MPQKKILKNSITRTISTWARIDNKNLNILRFMSHQAKNIYNSAIFHSQIYYRYSNLIFREILRLVRSKKITTIKAIDDAVYQLYDKYYQHYLIIKPCIKHNNDIIYRFIKKSLRDIYLINNNFQFYYKKILTSLKKSTDLKFPEIASEFVMKELREDILMSIMKSFYNKNFDMIAKQISLKKKFTIKNQEFINQVKRKEHLFKKKPPKYKSILKKHKLFKNFPSKKGVKSEQNYIKQIVRKYYKNDKIPGDLIGNIIDKGHHAYSSFFAIRKKSIKANIPKFLPYDGFYILPYFCRSRKEVTINRQKYYRLTVGSTVATKYVGIIDDTRYVCVYDSGIYKLYCHENHLIKLPKDVKIQKSNNYIVGNSYIPKDSEHIVEAYYIYVQKPSVLDKPDIKLKLIEIVPVHDGEHFKINYTYARTKTKNKPIKGKYISIDLGVVNLMTIYDPNGTQIIIKGKKVVGINNLYNKHISHYKSLLSKQTDNKSKNAHNTLWKKLIEDKEYIEGTRSFSDSRRITQKDANWKRSLEMLDSIKSGKPLQDQTKPKTSHHIRRLWCNREKKINAYFNHVVNCVAYQYRDCEKVIVGYNPGWKNGVNMGKDMNRKFCAIPFRKLLDKLRDKLESQNQELVITEESYTSKCDALALETIEFHENYKGNRTKRGMFLSSKHRKINADLNGAINIMRKWMITQGKEMNKIKGKDLFNPRIKKHL